MPQYNGVWTIQQQAQALTRQQWVTDPNFKNTTLLLQADNAGNGATNNLFLDSSTNGFTISTNVGVPPQGSFSPFSQAPGYWSAYNSGSGSFCQLNNSDYSISTGDFTIEFWMFVTSDKANTGFASATSNGNLTVGMGSGAAGARQPYLEYGGGTYIGTFTNYLNTWTHVAFVRSSGTVTVYQNGISVGTASKAGAVNSTANLYLLRNSGDGAQDFPGYISNFRICKAAVYTSAFTPNTTPFTTTSQGATSCQLLTFQNNRFIDNSSNASTVTPTVTTIQAFGPFAPALQWTPDVVGGSSYFAGANYLKTPSSSAFALGTGQFCLEAWHYPNNTNGGQILSTRTSGINQASSFSLMQYGATSYSMYANNNHVQTTMIPYQWNHVIVTRDASNTLRLILNGVLGNYEASYVENITETILSIGALNNGGEVMYGYTTGHRITKGSIPTAYQTASTTIGATIYTPPTQPVTLTSQGATSNNVSFLCNYANAGIYDGKMANNLETVGSAQVATSPVKYGSGSMYFNGSTGYLKPYYPSPTNGTNFSFGTGDFTIEFWMYPTTLPSAGMLMDGRGSGASGDMWLINFNSGVANWYVAGNLITSSAISANTWTHFTVCKANGSTRMFLNGIQTGSTYTDTKNYTVGNGWPTIGASYNAVDFFAGYMDDIRITKAARYIANFTPPQQALPRQ